MTDYVTQPVASETAGSNPGQTLQDAHRIQYANFLAALRGEQEVRVGLAENRQSISVIVGAYESARTGKPVRLPHPRRQLNPKFCSKKPPQIRSVTTLTPCPR